MRSALDAAGEAPSVVESERPSTVAASRVLRADEFFEHIEVRAFEARTKPESHSLWKLSDLWDDPTQDVARQPSTKAISRSRERSNYGAPAGKDTMCCEGLGTFGAVIGGAEL